MKKMLTLALAALLAVSLLAGCGSTAGASGSGSASGAPAGNFKIGVIQYAQHPALDAAYQGFVDGLAAAGFVDGENITIDYQNAGGDMTTCTTLANKFVSEKYDLILAIATPAAQAAAAATQDIPILVTAVTDPASAGLVASNEAPGGNVSGTSDLTPVAQQLGLIPVLAPEAKTVGLLFASGEPNSRYQIDIAIAEAAKLGLETKEYGVPDTNSLQQVVNTMASEVDVIYSPTDNMIASAASTVAAIANEKQIPFIAGERGMVEGGALASYSISYEVLGNMTGAQAARILKGEAQPATMPIEYQSGDAVEFIYNPDTAAALGITIPEDLLAA